LSEKERPPQRRSSRNLRRSAIWAHDTLRRDCRNAKLRPAKPSSIIAQVEGSGTPATKIDLQRFQYCRSPRCPPRLPPVAAASSVQFPAARQDKTVGHSSYSHTINTVAIAITPIVRTKRVRKLMSSRSRRIGPSMIQHGTARRDAYEFVAPLQVAKGRNRSAAEIAKSPAKMIVRRK
jgi:hypothetical protein